LQEHIALNAANNVIALNNAVSNTDGSIALYISEVNTGAHSALVNHLVDEKNIQHVEAKAFDSFASIHGIERLALALIDVEGFESEVIQGMQSTIVKQRPILVLELNEPLLRQRGMSVKELSEYICQTHRYTRFTIAGNGSITRSEAGAETVGVENGVFIPNEKLP
jgi:FkbM family methyltransferase